MSIWTGYNARRDADHIADQIARVKGYVSTGYSLFSAARAMSMAPRTLRRFLDRHDRHDLVEALTRYPSRPERGDR